MIELSDMQFFVRVVQTGSLSAAGRDAGYSPAAASKRLARIEAQLGVCLIHRTSRRHGLTEEGSAYYARCQTILADVQEAEALVTGGSDEPRGLLRITAPVQFGRHWVSPCVQRFTTQYPQTSIQLSLSDTLVDLVDSGFDLAVRIGVLEDSRMVSQRLTTNRRVIVAAPAYLAAQGTPQTPEDLAQHQCLLHLRMSLPHLGWGFHDQHGLRNVRVSGRLSSDNGELLKDWALAGLGLIQISIWDAAADLQRGALVKVLDDYTLPGADIHLVYPGRLFLPARTRLFIESLKESLRSKGLDCT